MREISFEWKGEVVRLIPTMQLLSRIAVEVRKATDGTESTVSLAYKAINGGLEPLFMILPLHGFLLEVQGDKAPSQEEIWTHISSNPKEALSFRMAYAEAVLPHITLGKDRAALSAALGTAQPKTSRRKSTSRAST